MSKRLFPPLLLYKRVAVDEELQLLDGEVCRCRECNDNIDNGDGLTDNDDEGDSVEKPTMHVGKANRKQIAERVPAEAIAVGRHRR